ncbi:hypothetical protein [Ferrimonas lipolytica]|uniref:Uncharacterized protein n=1 Tax=Ferrimonas lipolytica TaxID=2724191 RepID=A0A6H1UGX0_9GAMM|nr:hypothetical protein [Ferrimonas lipolytica]QIZ78068.1 hypothetical protein HER31_14880 [Ferrimonas lipolytica]
MAKTDKRVRARIDHAVVRELFKQYPDASSLDVALKHHLSRTLFDNFNHAAPDAQGQQNEIQPSKT